MPIPEELKRTVWDATHTIETCLAPTYPQRFPTINDAKLYVQKICAASNFDYGLKTTYNLRPTDPHNTVRIVKDRSCFLVAVRAHKEGEFYLDKGLPDRQSLRDAVEADMARVLALQHTWPTEFVTADVAAKFVAGVCALQNFKYTCFEGVTEERFRTYVCWNAARRAWEGRQFELHSAPKEWKRKEKKVDKKAKKDGVRLETMTDAIESDISRLSYLIPRSCWPMTFTDLNVARNFVGQWCYDNRFGYTGWPDVESKKYRLFVNFNAAKYALEAGVFRVERAVPPLQPSKKSVRLEKGGDDEREDSVDVLEFEALVSAKNRVGDFRDDVDRTEDVERVDHLELGRLDTSPSTLCPPSETSSLESSPESGHDIDSADLALSQLSCSPDTVNYDDDPFTRATVELEKKEAAAVDPFKDLVAELQRGYIFRAAVD